MEHPSLYGHLADRILAGLGINPIIHSQLEAGDCFSAYACQLVYYGKVERADPSKGQRRYQLFHGWALVIGKGNGHGHSVRGVYTLGRLSEEEALALAKALVEATDVVAEDQAVVLGSALCDGNFDGLKRRLGVHFLANKTVQAMCQSWGLETVDPNFRESLRALEVEIPGICDVVDGGFCSSDVLDLLDRFFYGTETSDPNTFCLTLQTQGINVVRLSWIGDPVDGFVEIYTVGGPQDLTAYWVYPLLMGMSMEGRSAVFDLMNPESVAAA